MTILVGIQDIALITDSTGTFTLSPGVPITDTMSPQTLVAGLVTDTDSFFVPTFVGYLSPALYSDTDAIYSPTIVAAAGALAPALFTDSDTIYAPTLVVGAATLLPGLVSDNDTIYAPVVASGTATLLPGLVSDTDAIFAASTAGPTAATLLPALVVSDDVIYAPSVAVISVTQTLLPGRVIDADTIYTPAVRRDGHLLPALFVDPETVYPAYSIDTAKLPHDQKLRAGTLNDLDVIYAARLSLSPLVVFDADVIYAPIGFAYYGLTAPFVIDADVFPAANIGRSVPLGLVQDQDTIYAPGITLFLVPQLVADADAIPTADVGWKVFAQFVNDVDQIFAVHVDTFNGLLPDIVIEDDDISTYPFFVHGVTGGIPVPPRPGILTGTVNQRRRLTGSLSVPRTLTGSVKRKGRVLTGSLYRK